MTATYELAAQPGRTVIDDLEDAIAKNDISRRADVLRRVADLFAAGSDTLTGERLVLFENVMVRLLDKVSQSARAEFGAQIADLDEAPQSIVSALALDESIEVAGPILSRCGAVADCTLIETAKKGGEDHLLAVAGRATLSEGVTDVLVDRGSPQVALSVAQNAGARFSEAGYSTLVKRAESERDLAATVWKRPEVPRRHLLALFEAASEVEREELQRHDPAKAEDIREMIVRAREELQANARETSSKYQAIHSSIQSLYDAGELTEPKLAGFARAGDFDETLVALSLMGDVPVGFVEHAMFHEKCDQLLILTKSVSLTWDTLSAILAVRARFVAKSGCGQSQAWTDYNKLQPDTARKAMQYYRLREQAGDGIAAS